MAVDRLGDDGIEKQPATDTRPPPPPPDRPGDPDFPSRLESRAAAAADVDDSPQPSAKQEDRPDTSSTGPADKDESQLADADTPDSEESGSPDSRETRLDGPDTSRTEDDSADEPPSPEHDASAADALTGKDPAVSDIGNPIEAADQRDIQEEAVEDSNRAPVDTPGEAVEEPHPDRAPNPDTVTPPTDEPAEPSTDITQATGPDADTAAPDQAHDIDLPTERPNDPHGPHPEEEQTADDVLSVGKAETAADGDAAVDKVGPDDSANDTVPADRSDALGAATEGDEATSADGPEPESPGHGEAGDERVPVFEWSTDDGRLARAYLDRNEDSGKDSDELELPGSHPDPPSGEELLEMENDEQSKMEKARKLGFTEAEDLHDVAEEVEELARAAKDLTAKPLPTGSTEASTGPEIAPMPHQGVPGAEVFTATVGTVIVIGKVGEWASDKISEIRTKRSGGA